MVKLCSSIIKRADKIRVMVEPTLTVGFWIWECLNRETEEGLNSQRHETELHHLVYGKIASGQA